MRSNHFLTVLFLLTAACGETATTAPSGAADAAGAAIDGASSDSRTATAMDALSATAPDTKTVDQAGPSALPDSSSASSADAPPASATDAGVMQSTDAPAPANADAAGDIGPTADTSAVVDSAAADMLTTNQARDLALIAVKNYITTNLNELVEATKALQLAAPTPDNDGWSNNTDRPAVDSMKASWRRMRQTYEHIEGAIAVLFPDVDVAIDERYDGFLETMADLYLFDGTGVTGVHAIERILWSDQTRTEVIDFEKGLKGYKAAAFPKTRQEAEDFKTKLVGAMITEVTGMRDLFKPLALDPAAAYRGVIGSIAEQLEKITKAETGEEESRYSNETLADMRFNVEGGLATHEAFRPWLLLTPMGPSLDTKIRDGFKRLSDAYGTSETKLPPVPTTWSATKPSAADLMTPFGKLYGLLKAETDDKSPTSVITAMNQAAAAMGIKNLL